MSDLSDTNSSRPTQELPNIAQKYPSNEFLADVVSSPPHASAFVLRTCWSTRNRAGLIPAGLIRDRLTGSTLPPAGDSFEISALPPLAPARFVVVRTLPADPTVIVGEKTVVTVLPALPPGIADSTTGEAASFASIPRGWQPVTKFIHSLLSPCSRLSAAGLPPPQVLLITGSSGSGRTSVVANAAATGNTQATLVRVSASDIYRQAVERDALRAPLMRYVRTAAGAAPSILLIDDIHWLFPPNNGEDLDPDATLAVTALKDAVAAVSAMEGVLVVLTAAPGPSSIDSRIMSDVADALLELPDLMSRNDSLWAARVAMERVGHSESARLLSAHTIVESLRGCTLAAVHGTAQAVAGRWAANAGSQGNSAVRFLDAVEEEARDLMRRDRSGEGIVVLQPEPSRPACRVLEPARDDLPQEKSAGIPMSHECGSKRTDVRPKEIKDTNDVLQGYGGATTSEAAAAVHELLLWGASRADAVVRLGALPPTGLLLYGPTGVGKTSLVRSVANALSLPIIALDAASLARGTVGTSERILRSAYAHANSISPVVVFLDEIDALFHSASSRLTTALMLLLDAKHVGVVTLGATNAPWSVPRTLLRASRLERVVHIPLPSADARADIGRVHASHIGLPDKEVQLISQALRESTRSGLSGADIAGAMRRAALIATAGSHPLRGDEVLNALRNAKPSVVRADADALIMWRPR